MVTFEVIEGAALLNSDTFCFGYYECTDFRGDFDLIDLFVLWLMSLPSNRFYILLLSRFIIGMGVEGYSGSFSE